MFMRCMVMACVGMADIDMAYIVAACIVLAYTVMAYIVMAPMAEHAAHRWLTSRAVRRRDRGQPRSWHLYSHGPIGVWRRELCAT